MIPPKICPGCRVPVRGQCPRCEKSKTPRISSVQRSRPTYTRRERTRRSDVVRAWVAQNGLTCPGYERPPHPADDLTADHVVPEAVGGAPDGPLRVLCRSCNSARGSSMAELRAPGLEVVLVAGPACSGKTRYVAEFAEPDDLVLDFDSLAEAMSLAGRYEHVASHVPLVAEARDSVLDRLLLGGHQVRRCWVISTAPKRRTRRHYRDRYGARVVVLLPSEETCLLRAGRERPAPWQRYVREWFDQYEPDPADEVVRAGRSRQSIHV
jgi:5-methylcytosine-specific restriction endonuclease McrA